MKKTLLLSAIASTMIMAGGDVTPVAEPVAEPVVETSGWEFGGTAVLYYQTMADDYGWDLFEQDSSAADAGIQLRASNKDVIGGVGFGFEVNGLATLGLEEDVVSTVMQLPNTSDLSGGWISQAYLTFGFGNTSLKLGRQELPKSLSPFAYSEKWNVFANTFDAALIVNSDLPDTTVVGAWVKRGNVNAMPLLAGMTWPHTLLYGPIDGVVPVGGVMGHYTAFNSGNGIFMVTVQNKSIENLTLTGSYYYASDLIDNLFGASTGNSLSILWGDATYSANGLTVGVQGGTINDDDIDDTSAFGAKVGYNFDGVNVMAAYSQVDDGTTGVFNVGGSTSALYTTTVLNQLIGNLLEIDGSKIVGSVSADVLGGNLSGAYAYTDSDLYGEITEFDLVYSAKVSDSVDVVAAYVYADVDYMGGDSIDVIRLVGKYNF